MLGGGKYLATVLAVVGVLLATPPFLPWISVSTETTLDPADPFATPFIVHNASYLPIYKVRVLCHFNRVVTDQTVMGEEWDVTDLRAVRTPFFDKIEPHGRATSECWFPFSFINAKTRLIHGDIEIVVQFRPFYYPWRQERSARFVMQKDSVGQERWFPAPKTATQTHQPK